MEDVKLPDLSEIREGRKRNKKLPPQTSAQDTSNWEGRTFSAPNLNTERLFDFSLPPIEPVDVVANPLLEQQKSKLEIRNKKSSTRGLIMASDDKAWERNNKKKRQ